MGERRIHRPTLREIAEKTGFSTRWVGYAMRGELSSKSADRIRAVANSIGYFPRGTEEWRLNCGVVLPSFNHPLYTEVQGLINRIAEPERISFIISSSAGDTGSEIKTLKWFRRREVNGVILFNPSAAPNQLAGLIDSEYPIIAIDAHPKLEPKPGLIRIDTGQADGVESAMLYLLSLGHKNISYITGPLESPDSRIRQQVYERILVEKGLRSFEDTLYIDGSASFDQGYLAVRDVLTRVEHLPTAILAHNDYLAIGAMQAIRDRGLQVPQDISVMGFGGSSGVDYSYPKLSTVAVSRIGLAKTVFSTLMGILQEGEAPPGNRIEVDSRLIVRESTAPPRSN